MKVVDLHLGRTGKTNRPFRFSILLCIAVVFLLAMVGAASAAIPTVTSVTPAAGPLAGGTQVTILGTGFINHGTTVYFGNTAVTSTVTVNGPGTQIVTNTPVASTAGPVDVTVVTVGGTSTTSAADVYTYRNVPAITSLSPNYGNTAGGNTVTITGTGFSQATAVMFGSISLSVFTVNSGTSITCTAPAESAGPVPVTVTTAGGVSNGATYTYYATPTITSIDSPAAGPLAGSNITITGTGFVTGATVSIGGNAGTYVHVASGTTLTCAVPAGSAGAVSVTVTTLGGTSNAATFTYRNVPTITSIAAPTAPMPAAGPVTGNNWVTIYGTGFGVGMTPVPMVFFGNNAATSVVVSAGHIIQCIAPPGSAAGAVPVTVITPGGTSNAATYTYRNLPTITAVTPNYGNAVGGNTVTISGTGFGVGLTPLPAVSFGNYAAHNVVVSAGPIITCTAPANAAGMYDVRVATSGGQSIISGSDKYTYYATPTVSSIASPQAPGPAAGPTAGGNTVTIYGTGLVPAGAAVSFGGVAATNIVASGTTLTCTPPAHAAGAVSVTVTTLGGTSSAVSYTYRNLPTVTAVSPNYGPEAGGNTVTITGSGFGLGLTPIPTVSFGPYTATNVNVVSGTSLTCTAPVASVNGMVNVVVTTPGGSSVTTLADQYTYIAGATVTQIAPVDGPVAGGNTSRSPAPGLMVQRLSTSVLPPLPPALSLTRLVPASML
jgi:hypothetical protein